ncbi:hypothetical protein HK405_000107, partial [Cladochytrium tenue]
GDVHRRQRSLINPTFRVKHIAAMLPIFLDLAADFADAWDELIESAAPAPPPGSRAARGMDIAIDREASKVTLDIIGRAGFAYEFNAVRNQSSPLYDAFTTVLGYNTLSVSRILTELVPFAKRLPVSSRVRYDASRKLIQDLVDGIILARQEELRAADASAKENDGGPIDLLSILIRANEESEEKISIDEVKAQVMTFLAAGHETTSVALSWTLHFLSKDQALQDRLRAELTAAFAPTTSARRPEVSYAALHAARLLDAVCKETLRLVAPVPMTTRHAAEDDVVDGVPVPRGTRLFICPGVAHRLVSIWGEDAEEYVPDRWLDGRAATATAGVEGFDEVATAPSTAPGQTATKPFGAYMPFLLGP